MDDYLPSPELKSSKRNIGNKSRSSQKTPKQIFLKQMNNKILSHLNLSSSSKTSQARLSKKDASDFSITDDDEALLLQSSRKKFRSSSKKKSKRSSQRYNKSKSSSSDDDENFEKVRRYSNSDSRSVNIRKSKTSIDNLDTSSFDSVASQSRRSSRSSYRTSSSISYSTSSSRSSSLNDSIGSRNSMERYDSGRSRRSYDKKKDGSNKKQRSVSSKRINSGGKGSATEIANSSPLHNESFQSTSYLTPTKRICFGMDKQLISSDSRSSSAARVSKTPEDYYKSQVQKHRQFIARATENSSSGFIRQSFSDFLPPFSSKNDDAENIFSPASRKSFGAGISNTPAKRFSTQKSYRLSERFTASTAASDNARYYRKRRSEPDMDFSPNVRSRSALSGKNFFKMEMKSTSFLDYLDADETNAARNILQTEVKSDVPYVDTHCHFDFLFKRMSFYESVDDFYEKTFFKFPKNFEGCITDWCQPTLYQRAKSLLNTTTKNFTLWGAFGCHPHFVSDYNDIVEEQIAHHITQYENVIAWGEMGLDYSDRFGETDHKLQQNVFIRQLRQACRRNLPLVIHCRDADPDLLGIMKNHVPHDTKIHRHCLTTEEKDVHGLLEHFPNCYVGFTNLLTNRSAFRPRDAVAKIPLNRILLETDAPYFIPRCVTAKSRANARWSHPGMASSVAGEVAYIKNVPVDEVLETIRDNVYSLYGI